MIRFFWLNNLYLLKVSSPETTSDVLISSYHDGCFSCLPFKTPAHPDSSESLKPCPCLRRGEAAGQLGASTPAEICPLVCQLINTKSFLMSTVSMATPLKPNAGRSTRALKIGYGGGGSGLPWTECSHGIVRGSRCAIFCAAAPCLCVFVCVWAD